MQPILALDSITDLMPVGGLVAAGAIVLVCLGVFGCVIYRDVPQFSFQRVWALATVCYRESIRRRVLWITPIAMIGIILISQLSQAVDPPDAIRQTIKYSLFASGLLVVLMAVIVSCTSLPKDIDTKVIFTVVTKPTTRFELVLGKIVGFARTTFMLLLVMGVFTWAYLHVQQFNWQRAVEAQLNTDEVSKNPAVKASLEYYRSHGLLETRVLERVKQVSQYAELPALDAKEFKLSTWQVALGAVDTTGFAVPEQTVPAGSDGKITIVIRPHVVGAMPVPFLSTDDTAINSRFFGKPLAILSIVAPDETDLVSNLGINGGKPVELHLDGSPVEVPIAANAIESLGKAKRFYVQVSPANSNYQLAMTRDAIKIALPAIASDGQSLQLTDIPLTADFVGGMPGVWFKGKSGNYGQQLRSPADATEEAAADHSIGVYEFADAREPAAGTVALELRFGLERSSDDSADASSSAVELQVRNGTSGEISPVYRVDIENNRPAFVDNIDHRFVKGGKFQVIVRSVSSGVVMNTNPSSLSVVLGRNPFALNLTVGMFCQWMLGVLAVTVGTFTSTFLSWPIAIVLSFLLLLGRWIVSELADSLSAGLGAQVATGINFKDPSAAKTVQVSVDAVAWLLRTMANYLPAIDSFGVGGFVERGLTVPWTDVGTAGLVLLVFGLPLLSLAYLILRNKEVAP
ncbi:MAG: hypothetical protein QM770_21355 [Tepidisphaeraceae bacterium]